MRGLLDELPGALLLAILTAVVTLLLLVAISLVVGGDNEQHRLSSRCFANQTTSLIRELILASDALRERIDLSDFPPIDITGIDCDVVFRQLDAEVPHP
jgi:hypothetical protein